MWVGLLFKLIPQFIKDYIPKTFIIPGIMIGVSSYFIIDHVNAKDKGLAHKIEMQQTAIQKEIAINYKFTAQQLKAIVDGIRDMKVAVQKVNDKVWELSRDVNAK